MVEEFKGEIEGHLLRANMMIHFHNKICNLGNSRNCCTIYKLNASF